MAEQDKQEVFSPDQPQSKTITTVKVEQEPQKKEPANKKPNVEPQEEPKKDEFSYMTTGDREDTDKVKDRVGGILGGGNIGQIGTGAQHLKFFNEFIDEFGRADNKLSSLLYKLFTTSITDVEDPNFHAIQRAKVTSIEQRQIAGARGDIYAQDPNYMEYKEMPPQLQSAISQMSLSFLSDLVSSMAPTRAPMASPSSEILGYAAGSIQQKEKDYVDLNRSIMEKNIKMYDANIKQKLDILKSMSEDEQKIMLEATKNTKDIRTSVENLMGKTVTAYGSEAAALGQREKTKADKQMANLKAQVDELNAVVASAKVYNESLKLEEEFKKENSKLLFSSERVQELFKYHNAAGGNALDFLAVTQAMQKYASDIVKDEGLTSTANQISTGVSRLSDRAYQETYNNYVYDNKKSKEENDLLREQQAYRAKKEIENRSVSLLAGGTVIDPDIMGTLDVKKIIMNPDSLTNADYKEALALGLPEIAGRVTPTSKEALETYYKLRTILNAGFKVNEKGERVLLTQEDVQKLTQIAKKYEAIGQSPKVARLAAYGIIMDSSLDTERNAIKLQEVESRRKRMEDVETKSNIDLGADIKLEETKTENKKEILGVEAEKDRSMEEVKQGNRIEELHAKHVLKLNELEKETSLDIDKARKNKESDLLIEKIKMLHDTKLKKLEIEAKRLDNQEKYKNEFAKIEMRNISDKEKEVLKSNLKSKIEEDKRNFETEQNKLDREQKVLERQFKSEENKKKYENEFAMLDKRQANELSIAEKNNQSRSKIQEMKNLHDKEQTLVKNKFEAEQNYLDFEREIAKISTKNVNKTKLKEIEQVNKMLSKASDQAFKMKQLIYKESQKSLLKDEENLKEETNKEIENKRKTLETKIDLNLNEIKRFEELKKKFIYKGQIKEDDEIEKLDKNINNVLKRLKQLSDELDELK